MFQVVIFEVLLKVEWIWEEEEGQLGGAEKKEGATTGPKQKEDGRQKG